MSRPRPRSHGKARAVTVAQRIPTAPPLREPSENCKTLGHFYEHYYCTDCGIQFCRAEHGGHSFEVTGSFNHMTVRDSYCYWCKRTVTVILIKDKREWPHAQTRTYG
jgi:hypothetical protein